MHPPPCGLTCGWVARLRAGHAFRVSRPRPVLSVAAEIGVRMARMTGDSDLGPAGCVICRSGRPLDVVAGFETCWATAGRHGPLPGYVCVVARKHYVEPFEMPPDSKHGSGRKRWRSRPRSLVW